MDDLLPMEQGEKTFQIEQRYFFFSQLFFRSFDGDNADEKYRQVSQLQIEGEIEIIDVRRRYRLIFLIEAISLSEGADNRTTSMSSFSICSSVWFVVVSNSFGCFCFSTSAIVIVKPIATTWMALIDNDRSVVPVAARN